MASVNMIGGRLPKPLPRFLGLVASLCVNRWDACYHAESSGATVA